MALMRYWKKHPPVHLLFAAFIGYENKNVEVKDSASKYDDPANLLDMFEGGVIR